MNIVFLGGGSLRILPIIRGLFATSRVMDGGNIRLVDLQLGRAQAVARLIQRCPEFKTANCGVQATDNLDKALEGADLFYLTMAIGREPSDTLAAQAAAEFGYLHSDQLSINGTFLGARAGGMVLNFARKMEKICPEAMMLIFANPVSVYSAAVSNYTKIKALGICAGFGNHRWDLPRICGRDCYDDGWQVVAAGVNHCSFILRGTYNGEDMNAVLDQAITPGWEPMQIRTNGNPDAVRDGLRMMVDCYRRFGTMIFSSEGDGMGHIFFDKFLNAERQGINARMARFDPATIAAQCAQALNQKFTEYAAVAEGSAEPDWNTPMEHNHLFGVDAAEISIPIIQALAGIKPMRINASYPNRGAVQGFSDRAALEYTMDLFGKTITPVENQYIPAPFHGLIASLSEHQTLLADAIAQQDGKLFATALEAYPVHRFEKKRTAFFRRMFEIFDDLNPAMKSAVDYLGWD